MCALMAYKLVTALLLCDKHENGWLLLMCSCAALPVLCVDSALHMMMRGKLQSVDAIWGLEKLFGTSSARHKMQQVVFKGCLLLSIHNPPATHVPAPTPNMKQCSTPKLQLIHGRCFSIHILHMLRSRAS